MRPLALSGLRIARSCSPGKRSAPGEWRNVLRIRGRARMRPLALSGLRFARSCSPGKRCAPGKRAQCPADTWSGPDAAFGLPATRSELAHAEAAALDPAGFQPLQRPAHLSVGDGHVGAGSNTHDLAA